jgi:hypothetical protein
MTAKTTMSFTVASEYDRAHGTPSTLAPMSTVTVRDGASTAVTVAYRTTPSSPTRRGLFDRASDRSDRFDGRNAGRTAFDFTTALTAPPP